MNRRTRCHSALRSFSARPMAPGVSSSPCSMFHTRPFCISLRHWGSLSAWSATMDSPRVPRTISSSSANDGDAVRTRAPRVRQTRVACSATRATSGSTGMRPPRSGVHATRHPRTEGRRTAARKIRVSTSYESGARSSGPAITESMSAMSATVRAMGPVTESEFHARSVG